LKQTGLLDGVRRRTLGCVLHPVIGRGPRAGALRTADAALKEAVDLARAIRLDVRLQQTIAIASARPATLFGTGKVAEIGDALAEDGIEVVIVDAVLTPVQQRNLECAWSCKVLDRTGLILELFGERARTREGRLQVELAALSYQKSRLVRSWTHLERQRGGYGFLGGPGERQIESDRRMIAERIVSLRSEFATVRRTRTLHRRDRRRRAFQPAVALVGYTNAGKSTLFNRLTGANVRVRDMPFATLDPTMRRLAPPGSTAIILSDTVGFVSSLPAELIAAFSATLEEVLEADIIVHVRDMSHPDAEAQKADVIEVLKGIGVGDGVLGHMVEVQNKMDSLSADERTRLSNLARGHARTICLSARTGEGVDGLLSCLAEALAESQTEHNFVVPLSDGAALAWLYQWGAILTRTDDEKFAHLRVRLSDSDTGRFRDRFERRAQAAD
jgi:GTP-binding protein HflX